MKTISFQALVILTFALLLSNILTAQYGNGGYGNGYGNGYGGNRRMNSAMDQPRTPDKPKEIPVEVTVGKILERLKPDLVLDELQVIAIGNILTESIRDQGMLIKAEVSQEEKIKNITVLSETTDRKIMELLNKDQKEKYTILTEEAKNPKKSKSKRKSN